MATRQVKVHVKVELTLEVDENMHDDQVYDIVDECDYMFYGDDGREWDSEIIETTVRIVRQ